jgi:hypothetical protein
MCSGCTLCDEVCGMSVPGKRQTKSGVRGTSPRVFFICGSLNQTTQMHQIARELPECEAFFSPFYGSKTVTRLRELGLAESTIGGKRLRARCLEYLLAHGLHLDLDGQRGGYDLVVNCTDVVIADNVLGHPLVVVQEGITDPENALFDLVRRFPKQLPRWIVGTAATGLSGAYDRFCVASQGYKDYFVERGAPADRVVVTGMPNFDDCRRFLQNDFPHRGYVLVCTSDARETYKLDARKRFLKRALAIAAGRPLIFKLHPNENVARATREISALAPEALIFASGPTDHMIANCDVLITQFSSVVFVGLALGKEVHSQHPIDLLQRLLPLQNGCAARNVSEVVRELLGRSQQPTVNGDALRAEVA